MNKAIVVTARITAALILASAILENIKVSKAKVVTEVQ